MEELVDSLAYLADGSESVFAAVLRSLGFSVMTRLENTADNLHAVLGADLVVFPPEWEHDEAAAFERTVAAEAGKQIALLVPGADRGHPEWEYALVLDEETHSGDVDAGESPTPTAANDGAKATADPSASPAIRTVYLSGPMTGYPEFNFPLFDEVAALLRMSGLNVISPADHDRQVLQEKRGIRPEDVPGYAEGDVKKYAEATGAVHDLLAWDFHVIMDEADAIVMLPGWEKSSGARGERIVAEATGKQVALAERAPYGWYIELDERQRQLHDYLAHFTKGATLPPVTCTITADPSELRAAMDEVVAHVAAFRSMDIQEAADAVADALGVESCDYASAHEVRVVDPSTGGAKGEKPQAMHLLPTDVLLDVSEHYYRGARKYEARNWERGYAWSLSYQALLRHLLAWWGGEDNDPEFGASHLRGVIFHALALRAFEMRAAGTDDRPTHLHSVA